MDYRAIIPFLMLTFCGAAIPSFAQTIDFETIPGVGVPVGTESISDQYLSTSGVSFSLEGGGSPVLAKSGDPLTAFAGYPNNTGSDSAGPSEGAGDFFLTDDGTVVGLPKVLLIDFATPVSSPSGVIIDIDNSEAWTIEARDSLGILESVVLNTSSPNSGDGLATAWSFDRPSADIEIVRIQFTGVASGGNVGLAFDNFSPVPISVPSHGPLSVAIAFVAVATVYLFRTYRQRA